MILIRQFEAIVVNTREFVWENFEYGLFYVNILGSLLSCFHKLIFSREKRYSSYLILQGLQVNKHKENHMEKRH